MHKPCVCNMPLMLLITVVAAGGPAHACILPERPFLPMSSEDMRTYADLIREDFESYITDVQDYFRCLDVERQRAFHEAQEVSRDYRRLLEILE